MPILPVIDLLRGHIVRGIAGDRKNYKPVVSKLTDSSRPLDVARAFRTHFRFTEIYVADLDAIAGQLPALETYHVLRRDGFRLWIDAGIRDAAGAASLLEHNVETIIAGLETIAGPAALAELVKEATPERVVFSLDLKAGQPLTSTGWPDPDPFAIAQQAIALGVRRLLVLDLAQVGVAAGVSTLPLCRRLRETYADLELTTGGGVRDQADVDVVEKAGVDWLLVASALHDGRVSL